MEGIKIGSRFGRLTTIEPPKRIKNRTVIKCTCVCKSAPRFYNLYKIKVGHTNSCGCIHKELAGSWVKTHGKTKTKAYRTWNHLKERCLNKRDKRFKDYGGRGIKVCSRWLKFENFFEDMGDPPSEKHSVDRINNNGNYEPKNCRWATRTQQNRNSRKNVYITYKNQKKCLAEWAKDMGIKPATIWLRKNKGWSVDYIFRKEKFTGKYKHKSFSPYTKKKSMS